MRIVMACQDGKWLDRRIMHEAKSLHEGGHQVFLFAGNDPDRPTVATEEEAIVFRRWENEYTQGGPKGLLASLLRKPRWLPKSLIPNWLRTIKTLLISPGKSVPDVEQLTG